MERHYPPFVVQLAGTDPSLAKIVADEHDLFEAGGALDGKTKMLIHLAVDTYAGSTAVKPIADLCRRAGASEGEICEALRIAHLIAGNRVLVSAEAAFAGEREK
jgi:alkylhydroperoxidase/carboxymuconolactone decarboxylase family protein YurZ